MLRAVRKVAEDALGESVTRAVVTVPAYFDEAQRQATRPVQLPHPAARGRADAVQQHVRDPGRHARLAVRHAQAARQRGAAQRVEGEGFEGRHGVVRCGVDQRLILDSGESGG